MGRVAREGPQAERLRAVGRLAGSAVVLAGLGAVAGGCGGGGGSATASPPAGSSGPTSSPSPSPSPSPAATPSGSADVIRPPFGRSVDPVALDDQRVHPYEFPGVPGTDYEVAVDTSPSGSELDLEVVADTGDTLFDQTVTTPFTTTVTPPADVQLAVRVFDPRQAGASLSSLVVTPDAQPYDESGFRVFVHICGDSFAGLGAYDDLATQSDEVAFVSDLLGAVNDRLPPQVQVDVGNSGLQRHSDADVAAADADLVANGNTVVPDTLDQQESLCDALGIPAGDPTWGSALDLFVVHSPNPASPAVTGQCACAPAGQGGLFTGTGRSHSLALRLFDQLGNPRSLDALESTLTHELGHFLSLYHTTEPDFRVDDLPDTPSSDPQLDDADLDGQLEPGEDTGPDATNVMFPFAGNKTDWTPGQVGAMQDYLSTRPH